MRRITLLLVGMLALFSTTAQKKKLHLQILRLRPRRSFLQFPGQYGLIDGNFILSFDKSFDADGKI